MKNAVIASLFLVPALLLTFFPAGCSGFSSDSEAALEAARVAILEEFNRVNIELRRAAERLGASGLTGCDARSALEDLYLAIPSAVDCAAVDSRGIMVTIEPASYRHHENKDISGQEQVKRMLDRREPVMTGIFLTVEGIEAGDAEYPVFGPEGAFLGSVSLLFSPEKLLDGALSPVSGKTDGLVVIDGRTHPPSFGWRPHRNKPFRLGRLQERRTHAPAWGATGRRARGTGRPDGRILEKRRALQRLLADRRPAVSLIFNHRKPYFFPYSSIWAT